MLNLSKEKLEKLDAMELDAESRLETLSAEEFSIWYTDRLAEFLTESEITQLIELWD